MPWCNCLQFHCYHEKCFPLEHWIIQRTATWFWSVNHSHRSCMTVTVTNINEQNAKSRWKNTYFFSPQKAKMSTVDQWRFSIWTTPFHLNQHDPNKWFSLQTFWNLSTSQLAAVLYGTCTQWAPARLDNYDSARSWGIVYVGVELFDETYTCTGNMQPYEQIWKKKHQHKYKPMHTQTHTHTNREILKAFKELKSPWSPSDHISVWVCVSVCHKTALGRAN